MTWCKQCKKCKELIFTHNSSQSFWKVFVYYSLNDVNNKKFSAFYVNKFKLTIS